MNRGDELSGKELLPEGVYELLLTEGVLERIKGRVTELSDLKDPIERADVLSDFVSSELRLVLQETGTESSSTELVNRVLELIGSSERVVQSEPAQSLKAVLDSSSLSTRKVEIRPKTSVREMALLTNAKGEPSLGAELRAELRSADRIDILMSFIRLSGLNQVYDELKEAAQRPGVKIRVVTSTYIGATEKKALDQLVNELGAEVKVDYEARHNRLHAKAWMIHRNSGFSTAYIGSSNMSSAAMGTGLEWNVRLTEAKSSYLLEKFNVSFETYWASDDFRTYDPATDGDTLSEALALAAGKDRDSSTFSLSGFEIKPWPYQQVMLDELEVARTVHGHARNLVVAATGTGKTVLAAFDYARQREKGGRLPNLLFVAHRSEILEQALRTFREVLRDPNFGELFVAGNKPEKWTHTFASIQSLSAQGLEKIPPSHFEHVIIDEFHHAKADSYLKLMKHLSPGQLLGLTATPERGDGYAVQNLFEGRIASELRLWDALDQELLTPFHYYGINDQTDYTKLDWSNGIYNRDQLGNLVTGNSARDRLVLAELNRKVLDPYSMKALVYCVNKSHSDYITELFTKHGIKTISVTDETKKVDRANAIAALASGEIQAISSVDVFNEGLDIPSIDVLVMLRPTESPVVFIQQLGRGLRLAKGKTETLVLDFVGAHRAEYRLDRKLQAMTGIPRGQLIKNIEDGFPFLPSGTFVSLDKLTRDQVLANVKSQVNPGPQKQILEIAASGKSRLAEYLSHAGRELVEVYRHNRGSWTDLAARAGVLRDVTQEMVALDPLLPSVKKFIHLDDVERIDGYRAFVQGNFKPWKEATEMENRLKNMFFWQMFPDSEKPEGGKWDSVDEALQYTAGCTLFVKEFLEMTAILRERIHTLSKKISFKEGDIPLRTHASYSRYELIAAIGKATRPGSKFVVGEKPTAGLNAMLEGVVWAPNTKIDLFLSTLQKSEADYSPQTRYLDYAISPTVFHWESQSRTTVESPVGQRYINHAQEGTEILLAIRDAKPSQDEPGSAAYKLLGLATYMRHEGTKPIKFWWELHEPMDQATFTAAAAVKVA